MVTISEPSFAGPFELLSNDNPGVAAVANVANSTSKFVVTGGSVVGTAHLVFKDARPTGQSVTVTVTQTFTSVNIH